ncbi:MAG TPA: hypothetical protein VKB36_10595 [Vicinamibacterales bacterium]|nr:hypothetical protein [Vicinamibacterales bacterium]
MAYTYHELKEKTLLELRAIAATVQHDAVKGASQMNKDHLLPALCSALGIDAHEHAVVVGIDKPAIKAKMHELKKQLGAALDAHDAEAVKAARRHLHHLNHQIRAHRAHAS